ncbi:MAG TPA: hypothetical protein PLR36_03340 [Ferruginibacter sp.]|nr:hypothetical protein [Ferruginibacter sp.]MBP8611358.1 hypothetical protein [Ferruginibacter sp.]HRB30001.1 hypothetical protein [Ferruginibacter sp.]HRB55388.1 hypothetical protein [Ferruginibacter sp.]
MNTSNIFKLSLATLAFGLLFTSCKKEAYINTANQDAALFTKTSDNYFVENVTGDSYTGTIGVSRAVTTDTKIEFTVSSPTGAVEGVEYTIPEKFVIIPAGQVLDSFKIFGDYAALNGGTHQLILRFKPEVKSFVDADSCVINLMPSCDEANPLISILQGDYNNTNETLGTSAYGPYTTSISSTSPAGPTSATIVVENIFDAGWGPITFTLDWTDPNNRTTTVIAQNAIPGSDAGSLNAAYAGLPVAVRPYATSGPGTYSACAQELTLNMQLGVGDGAGGVLGYFGILYQVKMKR